MCKFEIEKSPDFRSKTHRGCVASFHWSAWEGHKLGTIGVDSANRPHHVVMIQERLDVDTFRRVTENLVRRHPVLQAKVVDRCGRPWLYHDGSSPPNFLFHDLSDQHPALRLEAARQLASDFVWKRFDLVSEVPYRSLLIKVGATKYIFAFVLHHFVGDAISSDILYRETQYLYYALKENSSPELPPVRIQYFDYLLAMEEWSSSAAGRHNLNYWLSRFSKVQMPAMPELSNVSGHRINFSIDAKLSHSLRNICADRRATMFMVLLAAQKILCMRTIDSDDVIVAAVVNGRELPVLRRVVGYFADRTYYRTSLSGNPTFIEIVERVRNSVLEANRYPFVRFDLLQREMSANGGPIVAPVFNFRASAPRPTGGMKLDPWRRFEISPPPSISKPGFSVSHYWMELNENNTGFKGHIRPKEMGLEHISGDFLTILQNVSENSQLDLHSLLKV